MRPVAVVKRSGPLALAVGAVLALGGCRASGREPSRELVTQVEALTPSSARMAAPDRDLRSVAERRSDSGAVPASSALPDSSACPEVQRQVRELGALLPQQLDADTRATGVTAHGCDLRLEYELMTLSAADVSESGMLAMRGQVIARLCSDRGALGVMQRGGRFTNVYVDRARAPIGLFTVAADDCGI